MFMFIGSTSFPKPIRLTHRILVEWLRIPSYGEIDFCGEVIGAVALPMFHALGAINSIAMVSSPNPVTRAFRTDRD